MQTPDRTIAEWFRPRANSLNAFRLVLALLVIVSHAWPLTGHEPEPSAGGANLGVWAVFGFFGISGFLITRSRLSGRSAWRFYWARVLRIMPAFLVCLVVVAFGIAPLSLLFDDAGTWSPFSAVTFVLRNLALYPPNLFQGGIDGTLTAVPFPELWDGPLWTLFWEAACYLAIGVAASLLSRRLLPGALVVGFLGLTAVSLLDAVGILVLNPMLVRVVPLVIAFIGGALVFLYGDRIPVTVPVVAGATAVLIGSILLGFAPQFAGLPLAYLLIVLGGVIPLFTVGATYDISYGIYIYGWPVQQLIVLAFGPDLPLWLSILLTIAGTVPLALASCILVERPALSLKDVTRAPSSRSPRSRPERTRALH